MGAALHARRARFPASADRDRSDPAPGDRLHDAGPERPGEVGDPAGGAAGGRADDGPRVGRDARPHGADAPGARRAGASAATAGRREWPGRCKEGSRCRRSTSGCPGDVSAAAFWLVAGAIHPDAELTPARRRRRTRRAARSSTSCARMGADIEERPTAARDDPDDGVGEPLARPRRALVRAARRSTSDRPRSRRRSTRSRSCASPRPRRRARPRSAAPASCATRNRTGSPAIAAGLRGARRADRRRRRRHRASTAARRLRGADDRQPRRSPAGDDLRDRRPHRRRARPPSAGRRRPAISYPGFFDDLERVRA